MNDTMSKGLTFNNDVKITLGGKELTKGTDYTVTTTNVIQKDAQGKDMTDAEGNPILTGETSVEIIFKNFIQYKNQKDADIVVTYSATINEKAEIGVAGNPNKVTLTYSNNPNAESKPDSNNPDKPTPDSPVGTTPEKETYTYVTEIELKKVDDKGNPLAGAEFKIEGTALNTVLVASQQYVEDENGDYYKLKDGTYTLTAPTNDTSDKYDDAETTYVLKTVTETVPSTKLVNYTVTTGPDGKILFTGLAAGDFTITETKAPAGYNMLEDSITVTIGWNKPEAPSTNCTWTYKWSSDDKNALNTIEVVNKTGSVLPSTGGMGTTLFYVLGATLMLGAAVILITKRRMNAR